MEDKVILTLIVAIAIVVCAHDYFRQRRHRKGSSTKHPVPSEHNELRIVFGGFDMFWPGRWAITNDLEEAFEVANNGSVIANGGDGPRNNVWILCHVCEIDGGLAVIREVLRRNEAPPSTRILAEADHAVEFLVHE